MWCITELYTYNDPPVVRLDELFVLGLLVRLVVLSLKRAGTTFAAESLASNVMTQAATTMNPGKKKKTLYHMAL